ncbi:MAG: hypothetical protein A3K19_33690 [Lentisphaerae bacterium RIFOXYB12_FULL_65_16]|nr:MAG: hypothetical protein A3K19_30295 [Lentisphaerae bacterium RIFOXYB12_FULL_65_16]OGV95388.1 MAG: hypothetical protein A3K19_33690 [Lentisphaerae bacterium RIFOXYB12_FULL_65_16]
MVTLPRWMSASSVGATAGGWAWSVPDFKVGMSASGTSASSNVTASAAVAGTINFALQASQHALCPARLSSTE